MKMISKNLSPHMYLALCFFLALYTPSAKAQSINSINLQQCYSLAQENYPLVKEKQLIEQSKNFNLQNISALLFPQISLAGQATYQSDVTKITIPGLNIPTTSKDQYKLYGEVSQTLSDFYIAKEQKDMQRNAAAIQQENLKTELYKLRDRINQLYFGILLIDGQLEQNVLTKNDIATVMKKVEASIQNGTDFRTSLDKLKAEILKVDEREIELNASRTAYINMLSLFINKTIDDRTIIEKPSIQELNEKINRPELNVFGLQQHNFDLQQKAFAAKNVPHLNLFFQGGMGKPSPVNLLSRDLSPYYITGLRLNWNISNLYTLHKENLIANNDRKINELQQQTFLLNTKIQLSQQSVEVEKLKRLIATDNEIIVLRESIKNTAAVQLENGVINTNDYLKEVNSVDQARQNLVLHQIQLLQSIYNYNQTAGN